MVGSRKPYVMVMAGVAFAAVFSRLPVFDSWWCLDDWGQLARPAGLIAAEFDPWPARWLSQHLWWQVTWPAFGLNAAAHTVARLVLHALASVTVARIALRLDRTPLVALVAGALFAVTPIAFTPLYWASGVQELLAVLLALLAVERWLASGDRNAILAGLFGAMSILAKEPGLGLPVLFAVLLMFQRSRDRSRWAIVAILAVLAAGEAWLVTRHFAPVIDAEYRLITPVESFGNLGLYARWMTTLGPRFEMNPSWTDAYVGLGMWAVWIAVGIAAWRRGSRLPLVACGAAILSLIPALPLATQARAYMAFLAVPALTLVVALPVGRLRSNTFLVGAVFVLAASGYGYLVTSARVHALHETGSPNDPVVRAAHLSRSSLKTLRVAVDPPRAAHPVVYQPPIRPEDFLHRTPDGRRMAAESPRYHALGEGLGPAMYLEMNRRADWVGDLAFLPPDAIVMCETGTGLLYWGAPVEALVYGSLMHAVLGHFDLSREYLDQALSRDPDAASRPWDASRIPVPRATLSNAIADFRGWLENAGDAAPQIEFLSSLP